MNTTNPNQPFGLFSGFGIEIEYMIVDQTTLNVKPIADQLFYELAGSFVSEIEYEDIVYSNELALHLIELKTNGPQKKLQDLDKHFHQHVLYINQILKKFDAKLLPTGAHPWMRPKQEFKWWPHDQHDIYQTYHEIFNCEGHGWSNLQSVHLNLPFANDKEFHLLHTAIRLLLPIIPALSASTPIIESQKTPYLDTRLKFYESNQKKIPEIAGHIIPEFIKTPKDYYEKILEPMYQAIRPYDPKNLLQDEWLNSRGAIARFDRDAIEIRVIDTQECPAHDLAIITLIARTLEWMITKCALSAHPIETKTLKKIYDETIQKGFQALITNQTYLSLFGYANNMPTNRDFWNYLLRQVQKSNRPLEKKEEKLIQWILTHGNLAERILRNYEKKPTQNQLKTIYESCSNCLTKNRRFK